MTAAEIAKALGNAQREGRRWRTDCPVHGGHSLTLADGRNGRLLLKCWGGDCAATDIFRELRRLGFGSDGDRDRDRKRRDLADDRHLNADMSAVRRVEWAKRLWEHGKDARRSPVVRYLAGRGIILPMPSSLRWVARCGHPTGVFLPAMVARIDSLDGELIGVLRTYLRPDGSGKAGFEPVKAMLGRAAGGAVRLAPAGETLMVAEGVETALAAMQATGLPAWAALSAGGIEKLTLSSKVCTVIILADNDVNGRGQRAANLAAARWLGERRQVRIAMPPEPGTDFNGVLAGMAQNPRVRDVAA